jgi:hypothetical protein
MSGTTHDRDLRKMKFLIRKKGREKSLIVIYLVLLDRSIFIFEFSTCNNFFD